jgi:nucleotide-binding universal stress UspA family protein
MKVLMLLKNNERDDWLIDFVEKLTLKAQEEITLLNMVVTPQEIPVKRNGEVLDFCTEFDLSGYHNEAKKNLDYLQTLMTDHNVINRMTKVGRPIAIVEDVLANGDFDLLVSDSHLTTAFQDLLIETCTSRLIEKTQIPYLTLKCDRRDQELKHIGLINEFDHPQKENLAVLNEIRKASGAKVCLVKIKTSDERLSDPEIMANMNKFCELNNLEADKLIYSAEDKEEGIKEVLKERDFSLLAIGNLNDNRGLSMFAGNLNANIVNHVTSPILIY